MRAFFLFFTFGLKTSYNNNLSGALQEGLSYLPGMLYVIGILSCFGMTVAISLFSDMLCLFTAHIYACYLLSTTVYHHQLKTAGSLWNLFRGMLMVWGIGHNLLTDSRVRQGNDTMSSVIEPTHGITM